jgi:hypothetical protein
VKTSFFKGFPLLLSQRYQSECFSPLISFPFFCSQTMMSQFMNGATRVKGWTSIDLQLDSWAAKFNAQLKTQTELIEKQQNQHSGESSEHRGNTSIHIHPNVIKLSDHSNFNNNNRECESSIDRHEFSFFQSPRVSYDQGFIEDFTNYAQEANVPVYLLSGSRASGDWSSFDIHGVFFTATPS